jgi:hypothetical protein
MYLLGLRLRWGVDCTLVLRDASVLPTMAKNGVKHTQIEWVSALCVAAG